MPGKLYLVGTPIGNLGDLSPRALETLNMVDFIAAEDTRVTQKLTNHFSIKKPFVSYYEHNRFASGAAIMDRLLSGESCALVSDAGMPAISDPGEDLVFLCAEKGIEVVSVPGPCAAITALAASALPTQRFCFEGFLTVARKGRFERLEELKGEKRTMIFYEAPHKVLKTLQDMLDVFGDRELSVARELTKIYEEIIRTSLSGALKHFSEKPPKGEFVLVVRGAPDETPAEMTEEQVLAIMDGYRKEGHTMGEAAKLTAAKTGMSKNELYALALKNV